MKRGFTLLELLVSIAVVAVFAGISFRVFPRMTQSARAAACLTNLRQLGSALNLYLGDHNATMPTLQAGRHDKSEDLPVIDNTLNVYTGSQAVFACPADRSGLADSTGTSYYWNVALNGQALASLNFLSLSDQQSRIPILVDKEGFHPFIEKKVNLLYADGHVSKDLSFIASDAP